MEKLIQISFAPANFILSLLVIVITLYWLIVIFTGFDFDTLRPILMLIAEGISPNLSREAAMEMDSGMRS